MDEELVHKDCGGKIKLEKGDNAACGDPECCGAYEEYPKFTCEKCGKSEVIY